MMSSEMQGVISSKRMVVLATAVVLTVVMYCAQSCFNMDTGQPVCPQHHTADCCKHETLVSSSALQTMTAFFGGTAKFLPSSPLAAGCEAASIIFALNTNVTHLLSVPPVTSPDVCVYSPVLRI